MLMNPKWCQNQKKSKPDDENSSSDREENEKPNTVYSSDEYDEHEDILPLVRNTSSTGKRSQNKRTTRSSTHSSKELNSKQPKISTKKEISSSQTDDTRSSREQDTKIEESKDDTDSPNPCDEVPLMHSLREELSMKS